MKKKHTIKYKDKQKLSLLDYIMNNPNYFNPRNINDFSNMNNAMLWTENIDQALDMNRLGHYSNDSNYFIPNTNVTDLVRQTKYLNQGTADPKVVAKMTKELLKGM